MSTFPGPAAPTASPPEFSVSTALRDGCRIVAVEGDLDELTAPEVDAAIGEPLDSPAVVDLSGLAFIASAGIHVLLRRREGGRPAVVCPPGHIARVLEIVGASTTMRLFEDVSTAIAAAPKSVTAERGEARHQKRGPRMWPGRSHEKRPVGRA